QEPAGRLTVSLQEGGDGELEPEVPAIVAGSIEAAVRDCGIVVDGSADLGRQLAIGNQGTVKKPVLQQTAEPARRQSRSREGAGGIGRSGQAEPEGLLLERDLPGRLWNDLR